MTKQGNWIRRDRETGKEETVTLDYVLDRLEGKYFGLKEALDHASKDMPLTNGFADYYPKE